ncbi:MAG TPA: hypothetical protein VK966_11245 [Longimicrobiales bacterium]|nr:hypothetical protein [Longimicrobiales bacterium]
MSGSGRGPRGGGHSESDGRRRVVDRADYDPDYDPGAPVGCEVCGGEMFYTAACKLKCPACGYMRDCSDP